MTEDQYVEWLTKFFSDDYSPDYLSPFSANSSILSNEKIPDTSIMSDRQAEFELTVFRKLRATDAYKDYSDTKLIGPDRETVQHTINVMESYTGA